MKNKQQIKEEIEDYKKCLEIGYKRHIGLNLTDKGCKELLNYINYLETAKQEFIKELDKWKKTIRNSVKGVYTFCESELDEFKKSLGADNE